MISQSWYLPNRIMHLSRVETTEDGHPIFNDSILPTSDDENREYGSPFRSKKNREEKRRDRSDG
jgi:hypothetical protein